MDVEKREALEAAGVRFGTVAGFLGLSPEEEATIDRKDRLKRITVSGSILLEFLNGNFSHCPVFNSGDLIPGDAEVVFVTVSPAGRTVDVVIRSASFPEVPSCYVDALPRLCPEFTRL